MTAPLSFRIRTMAICACLIAAPAMGDAAGQGPESTDTLVIGDFSAAVAGGRFPQGWAPLTFDKIHRHSQYELINDAGVVVVKASSADSASGMIRRVRIDPRKRPVVRWRWKVENVYRTDNETRKDGDDYPARLYVTFHYDAARAGLRDRVTFEAARLIYGEYPPMGTITYVWASSAPLGSIFPNPYTDKVKMIVMRTGGGQTGQWLTESRNLLDDYRRAFGADPPDVSGVAIMTDSDNTGQSAVAYYGDIEFLAD